VLAAARADPAPSVRRRACEEAGRALPALLGADDDTAVEAALAVLLDALDDSDDAVAEAAAWATGEAGSRAAGSVGALGRMSRQHRSPLCREAAVAALGAVGDPGGLDAVLAALDDRPAVRRRAAVSLAAFDDRRAEAGLRRCAGDRDWQVRQIAEELLGRR
jgi:HEAT repeat protein